MARKAKKKPKYRSMSLPSSVIEEIEKLVEELGYWPTKTAFIREACLEKMEKHRNELARRREEAERMKVRDAEE